VVSQASSVTSEFKKKLHSASLVLRDPLNVAVACNALWASICGFNHYHSIKNLFLYICGDSIVIVLQYIVRHDPTLRDASTRFDFTSLGRYLMYESLHTFQLTLLASLPLLFIPNALLYKTTDIPEYCSSLITA
jgi:hypothetical protein